MRSAAFLPAGIILIGIYLLVASAVGLPGGAVAVGTLAIAALTAAGMTASAARAR